MSAMEKVPHHEARWWQGHGDSKVRCHLCMFRCIIQEGKLGHCGVRKNIGGVLYSLNYDKVLARNVDPIEKKPLHHFLPGTFSYSVATAGCNFRCLHCQNADISQLDAERRELPGDALSPQDLVSDSIATGCKSISYTYTEPTIFAELALDTAAIAKKAGLKNVFVTNGYQTPEFIKDLAPLIDAANVDLKGADDEFYKKICSARIEPVKEAIRLMHEAGVWVEVTTLVIPGLNDSAEQLRAVAKFLVEVGSEIPWHVTQFYPTHLMTDRQPTSASAVALGRDIGLKEGLKYVYASTGEGEHTFCPSCKALLVRRRRFLVAENRLKEGKCPECQFALEGVWS